MGLEIASRQGDGAAEGPRPSARRSMARQMNIRRPPIFATTSSRRQRPVGKRRPRRRLAAVDDTNMLIEKRIAPTLTSTTSISLRSVRKA